MEPPPIEMCDLCPKLPEDMQNHIKETSSLWKRCDGYYELMVKTHQTQRQMVDLFFWEFMDELAETVDPTFVSELMSSIVETMESITGPFYTDPVRSFDPSCIEDIRTYHETCEETRRRCAVFLRHDMIPTFLNWIDRLEAHIYEMTGNAPISSLQWNALNRPFATLYSQWAYRLYDWVDCFDPETGISKGDVVRETEHLCRKYQVRVPAYIAFLIRPQTGPGTGRDIQDMIEYVLQTMFEGVKGGWEMGDSLSVLRQDWVSVASSLRRFFYHGVFASMAELRDRIEIVQDRREHFPNTHPSEGETDALEDLFGRLTRSYRAFKEELKDAEDVRRL